MAEHPLIGSFSVILGLSHVLLLVPSTLRGGGVSVSQAQHGSPPLDQTQGLFRITFIKELKDSCFDA